MRKEQNKDREQKEWCYGRDLLILEEQSLVGEQWQFLSRVIDDPIGDCYLISNYGRVFDCDKQKMCEVYPDESTGYIKVSLPLCPSGYQNYNVHRLVALAFVSIPSPDKRGWIHHIDGDRHNNRADNLLWVAPSEHAAMHVVMRNDTVRYYDWVAEMRQKQPVKQMPPLFPPEWRT